ncbi:2Fe-2S iron-sulfur cluster-binding protein [Ottowia thiooxydans]|uniref:2Fe-2S iron-sulfur cluster-binding protein n=1 Tax=Ottowia thiooxydans TaxID=219182 RepID=UPI00041F3CA9|nr:2Fe-2S iron-sulfur cluster-binding protein [Ottowia thiooxydans]
MHYDITIANTGESFGCTAEQSLLSAMERLGRKGIPVGCRNGGCGVCKVRVREGSFRMAKMSRAVLSLGEQDSGCTLACKTFPDSALVVEIVGAMARAVCAPRPSGFDFEFKRPLSKNRQET